MEEIFNLIQAFKKDAEKNRQHVEAMYRLGAELGFQFAKSGNSEQQLRDFIDKKIFPGKET